MSAKKWITAAFLVLFAGCTFPVREDVDQLVCRRSMTGFDMLPERELATEKLDEPSAKGGSQDPKKKRTIQDRLPVNKDIPGAEVPPIVIPRVGKDEYRTMIEKVIGQYFPDIPKVDRDQDFPLGPDGRPLTLSDLQQIAFANNPVLRQVAADVQAARGMAIQAGMYPNPYVGYQSSSAGPGGGPIVGMIVGQTIKTGGKLKLAQAAAIADLRAAEFAYQKAEADLLSNIRAHYYAVLVAQETIRANRGVVELTDEVYRVMVDQLRVGEVSPYEPNQLAVFAEQARLALVQSRNTRHLAWRQLAAAMGVPHMPPVALAGNANRPVPKLDFEKALAHILSKHTDVLATDASIEKARQNLRLAQVTPYPDVSVQAGLANDLTPPGPSRLVTSLQVSVPIPLWDRNKGNIMQSQAALVRANEEPHRVQADLTARFSEAYNRYETNRVLLEIYRKQILPKQVQAFRGAVLVHFGIDAGKVSYSDLVQSEQNLVAVIPAYLAVLANQWQAVVDVSNLLQTDQLYQMAEQVAREPEINLEELLRLPCHHRCPASASIGTPAGFGLEPVVPVQERPQPIGPRPERLPQPAPERPVLPAVSNQSPQLLAPTATGDR
ncbi:MAG TPA: TolC family protein [Gemmataceae bacterium]|nr:TolC family protein [Gemmataceae bacterium]